MSQHYLDATIAATISIAHHSTNTSFVCRDIYCITKCVREDEDDDDDMLECEIVKR